MSSLNAIPEMPNLEGLNDQEQIAALNAHMGRLAEFLEELVEEVKKLGARFEDSVDTMEATTQRLHPDSL